MLLLYKSNNSSSRLEENRLSLKLSFTDLVDFVVRQGYMSIDDTMLHLEFFQRVHVIKYSNRF